MEIAIGLIIFSLFWIAKEIIVVELNIYIDRDRRVKTRIKNKLRHYGLYESAEFQGVGKYSKFTLWLVERSFFV